MSLKFCANLNFLFSENGGFLEKYRAAHKAGFKGVETGIPNGVSQEEVIKVKNDTGLEHVLLNICTDGGDGLQFGCAAIPGAEKQFQKNIEETVCWAKALNCKKIHIMAGKCPTEPNPEHLETYLKNLKFSAKLLESENLIGLIEPINKYAIPGYFLNNYKTATDVLDRVNSQYLKLMVDVYHLQHIQGNVTNTLQELSSYIGHIQIAQVPHRHEPNVPGELNFGYVFQAIEKSGYNGWVGCEYKPKKSTAEGLNWIKEFGYQF